MVHIFKKMHSDSAVCRHWSRSGFCLYGSNCKFTHPILETLKQEEIQSKSRKKRNKVRKSGRAGYLRRWLIDNFGLEYLRCGSGVLEVAGGLGNFAWELENLNQIPCVVLDPRAGTKESKLKAEKLTRKLEKGFFDRTEPLNEYNQDKVLLEEIRNPMHLRVFWEEELWRAVLNQDKDPGIWMKMQEKAKRVAWTSKGLENQNDSESEIEEEEEEEYNYEWEQVSKRIHECSIIVGIHPDQAAGDIVDFALASNKPFAIIPCCVYAKQFPKRRLEDGSPVQSYDQLIQFIMQKDPSIKSTELNFQGKNILLFKKN
jgi:hypothetical protein